MRSMMRKWMMVMACVPLLVLAGCTEISPGNVGIQVSKVGSSRGVQDVTLKTGYVIYNPAWTEIIEYPTSMKTAKWTKSPNEGNSNSAADDESITFLTKDSSAVNADVSVSYQLRFDKAPEFYVKFRADDIDTFTDGYLRNIVRDAFNEAASNYAVEDVMGKDASNLLLDVRKLVQVQLDAYGVQVEQLGFMGAPRPPDSVINSINMKVQAQQIALQKQTEVTQAEADAKKTEAWAQGDAQANIIRAQADATANKLRAQSLTPELVEWTKIQKWDGKNPDVVSGAGGSLMVAVK